MQLALPFPDIDPVLFSVEIGPLTLALRWYALAYIGGILIGWWIIRRAVARPALWHRETPMVAEEVDELLTWIIVGIILGGRLGFVFFYQPAYYLENPLDILKVWEGGMAFHGGLLGVGLALLLFSRRFGVSLVGAADLLAIATPPGLLLGRIANFVNAELWGRPTDMPWGVIFPGLRAQSCPGVDGLCARHPSQLYEAGLEGLLLGGLLLVIAFGRGGLKVPGQMTGLFLAGYGIGRFIVEYFRQADPQFITLDNPMGFVLQWGWSGITMGQLLSLPMVALGLAILAAAHLLARRSKSA
ncbi:MAG: prolipoprotein diacylglyceryl transferase [Pseudomonadota bacterium]